jgi:WD40 repeat protein
MDSTVRMLDREGNALRVFISYGRADAEPLAVRLESDLTRSGFQVWLDKSQMRAGRSWEEQIERQILSSQVVVSLLTPHAVRRPDGVCLDEISFARYHGRRIVPLMVRQCQPPLGIYRLDWIDFLSWEDQARYEHGLLRLTEAISSDRDRVDGQHARLLGSLKPLDFGVEVSRLTRKFTGRQWLFDDIDAWLRTGTNRFFLITGDPGTGKSAVMARLIDRHPSVCASHFCISSLSDSLSPFRFACSIAAQLATQLDDYRLALDTVNLENIETLDASTLWRRVIVDPLFSLTLDGAVVIVVDALDEAMGVRGGSIPRLLRDQADALPPNIRFVVSMRKDPDVLDSFSGYQPHDIGSSSTGHQDDIAVYINTCLQEPRLAALISDRHALDTDVADTLAAKADRNFLYATQAVAALEGGRLDPLHPEQFPDGLVGIYQEFFERLFADGEAFLAFRPLLEVLCAAREALTAEQVARILGKDRLDVEVELDRVAAFFPESQKAYRAYHKSIVDWLSGEAGRSRRFRVDVQRGHRLIADSLLRDFQGGIRESFCLAHLPAHLYHGGNTDALNSLLGNPAFVLAKASIGMFGAAIDDYQLANAAEFQTLRDALILSSHVAISSAEELPGQLRGRLCGFADERLVDFVHRIEPTRGAALLPQTASLTPPGGPLARTILNPDGDVHGVAVGKRRGRPVIVSCGWGKDKAVRLWDLATGDPIGKPLTGHSEVISAVAFGRVADGTTVIASGSHDATVRLWDAETGEPYGSPFDCLKGAVRGVAFVEFKGKPAVLALSAYGTMLLDLESHGPSTDRTYGGLAVYIALPDGQPVVVSVSEDNDKAILVQDVETGEQYGDAFVGHRLPVSALAVGKMPNGEQVLASGSFDATVRLWRLESGQEIVTFRGHAEQYEEGWTTLFADRAINDLAFGDFGGVPGLVSASGDHTLRVWNLETLKELGPPLTGHDYGVNAVAWGRLGESNVIVSGSDDRTIRIWKPLRATRVARRPDRHDAAVTAMTFTRIADELFVVTGSREGSVRLSSGDSGMLIGRLVTGSKGAIQTLAIGTLAAGVPVVATGGSDGYIRIWNLQTRKPLGKPIAAGGGGTDSGGVWSIKLIEARGRVVIAATVGYRNPWVHFWDLATGREMPTLDTGHHDSVPALAWGSLRDSPVLITAGQDDSLRIWNPQTMGAMRTPLVGHTGWSPSWQTAALADSIACGELADGTPIILCPHVDRTIRVVVAESGQEVVPPLVGHTELMRSVRFGHLDGKPACVSAGFDRSVRVWDLTSGRQVAAFTADAPVLCCEIDSVTGTVFAGDHSGAIHILNLVSAGGLRTHT